LEKEDKDQLRKYLNRWEWFFLFLVCQ
jgi:hypothetical protein